MIARRLLTVTAAVVFAAVACCLCSCRAIDFESPYFDMKILEADQRPCDPAKK